MSTISIIFGSVLLACALFLIVAVLLQNSQKGLSGAIAGGSSDTYFGKNKGKSKQKKLSKLTAIATIIFVVLALATFIVGR